MGKQHWPLVALSVAGLGVGFLAGWNMRAPVTVVQYRDRIRSFEGEAEHAGKADAHTTSTMRVAGPTIRVFSRTIRVPDGTIATETERHESGGTTDSKTVADVKIEYRDRERLVYRDRDVTRTEEAAQLPQWSASIQAGASIVEPLISLPKVSRGVLGFSIERRIAGPFTAGVWASSVGAAGVSIGARW